MGKVTISRELGIKTRIPRKLKKAAKHIIRCIQNNPPQFSLGTASQTFITFFTTENSYPYTKWVRKAIGKARYGEEMAWKKKTQMELERINQPLPIEDYKRCREDFVFWKEHYYGDMIPKQ